MTESRHTVFWRCALCERGVHEDECIEIKATQQIVCPRCFDDYTTTLAETTCLYCDEQTQDKNDEGEPVCTNCASNRAEAAWERHYEDFHDGGCTRFNPPPRKGELR